MCFFFSLIPVTWFVVVGFFVLFAASMAQGAIKGFGQILAVWFFACVDSTDRRGPRHMVGAMPYAADDGADAEAPHIPIRWM
jgi:hypothetical protein